MADRGTRTNPGTVGGPNEYAGFDVPSRPDQTTNAQPGGYYGGSGGNQVDRRRINKTLNRLDKNSSQSKPLGQDGSSGF